MAPGNMSLPPNLTQQHVQEVLHVSVACGPIKPSLLFSDHSTLHSLIRQPCVTALTLSQKFKQMQEQGVRHDDPEYLKAHNLLSAIQRQQAYQKQRQFAQQQQQLQAQQRQQQMNGGDTSTNGARGSCPGAFRLLS
jgi:ATP-dependent helicase STH1/SNF2